MTQEYDRAALVRGDGSPIEILYAAGKVPGSGATMGSAFVPGMMLTLGRLLIRFSYPDLMARYLAGVNAHS